MAVDVLFEVGHAAVTDFHCVTVEDLECVTRGPLGILRRESLGKSLRC